MSKERLEVIDRTVTGIYDSNTKKIIGVDLRVDDYNWLIEQAEQVDSMANIIKVKNKEMRELSDFLKERNIPLKELSPLITVMNYVQELEEENEVMFTTLNKLSNRDTYSMIDGQMRGQATDTIKQILRLRRKLNE